MIDIVIVSYHRPEFTSNCLSFLTAFTETEHRIIVVDNGSDNETVRMLLEERHIGVIDDLVLLEKNRGLEPAKNIGLSMVTSELYVDTDNDCIVPPPDKNGDWLSKIVPFMKQYSAVALPPQVFIGADKNEMFKDAKDVLERDFVGGSLRLMRTADVREVGGWRSNPTDMTEANRGEEHYICGKLRKKGHKVGYAVDVECFHQFGETAWGYAEDVEHYHRAQWPIPSDTMFGSLENWLKKFHYEY